MLNCPDCNRILMDSTQDGGYKLRTRMVLFTSEGHARAICPSCKTEVDVPYIGLTAKLPQQLPKAKIVISKAVD